MAAIDLSGSDKSVITSTRCRFLGAPFDTIPQRTVLALIQDYPSDQGFRYVVTPNVDYVVRMRGDAALSGIVSTAWLCLCDSRPLRALARLLSLNLPLVTGSDLTAELFRTVVKPGDVITLVASSDEVVAGMRAAYPHVDFRAIVPPAGVKNNPKALQECVDYVIEMPSRFTFLAIGSPQSELISYRLAKHPQARGIGLNIGASLEFLVGIKRRAPGWMQTVGLEWLHRLVTDPKRLWRRYVYSVIPLVVLFLRELTFRRGWSR